MVDAGPNVSASDGNHSGLQDCARIGPALAKRSATVLVLKDGRTLAGMSISAR
jgi:hypothetical protein